MTRAKFECTKVEKGENGSIATFHPVTCGSEENEKFFALTPYGQIFMGTINPNVMFEVGKQYYVDFSETE